MGVPLRSVVLLSSDCSAGGATGPTPTGKKYSVVATAYPVFEAVGRIGGKRVHATNLAPVGAFDNVILTPTREKKLREAAVVFILGKGTQPQIERIAAQRRGPTIALLDTVAATAPIFESRLESAVNPYVWLDPKKMAQIAERVRLGLAAYDPNGTSAFRKNAKRWGKTVAALDRFGARVTATCKKRELITTQPVYEYLTDRYGIDQVPLPLDGPSTRRGTTGSSDRPSDATLAAIVERYRPQTIYFSVLPTIAEAERYLKSYGFRSAVLDPIADQSDHVRRGGGNYSSMMGLNLDAVKAGLDCDDISPGD